MKTTLWQKVISALLTGAILMTASIGPVAAAAEDNNNGKYVSDVYIAYGSSEEDAASRLPEGYKAVKGNFNEGRNDKVAVVMGVKTTDDAQEAVTDMRIMNMKGGYSFADYEQLLGDKKEEVKQFVFNFLPAIKEFRENYKNGEGVNKARAEMALKVLNKYFDGDPTSEFARNDTGKPLGDLLLGDLSAEVKDYENLAKNDKAKYGDLVQILIEGNGPTVTTMKQMLALASDSDQDSTWLDRATTDYAKLLGDDSLSDSQAEQKLALKYDDIVPVLQENWEDIHDELSEFDNLCAQYNLVQGDEESLEDYGKRVDAFFEYAATTTGDDAVDLKNIQNANGFYATATLFYGLQEYEYKGVWGDTLLDFFLPSEGISTDYATEASSFYGLAAGLSEGQRASLDLLSLRAFLMIGLGSEDAFHKVTEEFSNLLDSIEEPIDVYSGINRGVFRSGVAVTSAAMMEKARSGQSFVDTLLTYSPQLRNGLIISAAAGLFLTAVGTVTVIKSSSTIFGIPKFWWKLRRDSTPIKVNVIERGGNIREALVKSTSEGYSGSGLYFMENNKYLEHLDKKNRVESNTAGLVFGWTMIGVGAALMAGSVALFVYDYHTYKNPEFPQIPKYIVDRADIEEYDENGKLIGTEFKDYTFYQVVKCNRQEVGVGAFDKAQKGVDKYQELGCGDAADLGGDAGVQWLALYTVKDPDKGAPILTSSLTLQTGSSEKPEKCNTPLRFFNYDFAADLGDAAYSYQNEKNGVYLFWYSDQNAYNTSAAASSFSGGQLALVGVGSFVLGLLGATLFMLPKRKQEQEANA